MRNLGKNIEMQNAKYHITEYTKFVAGYPTMGLGWEELFDYLDDFTIQLNGGD